VKPDTPAAWPAPFVVGAARSGTTMLRLMLDAHSEVAIPPETGFVPKLIRTCERQDASTEGILELLTTRPRWPDFGIDQDVLARRLRALPVLLPAPVLRTFYSLYSEKFGKPRWGDKTPRYLLKMRRIQRALPEARFIHVIRDGRDVALSMTDLRWRPDSLVHGAREWREHVQAGRRQGARVPHYLEVRYEDLILDTESTLRGACDFLELPWDAAMLDYHRTAGDRMAEKARETHPSELPEPVTAAERVGIHALTSRPPVAERIGRARRELSKAELAAVESVAGDLLVELGYSVGPPAGSPT
jgi:hypothetical protein